MRCDDSKPPIGGFPPLPDGDTGDPLTPLALTAVVVPVEADQLTPNAQARRRWLAAMRRQRAALELAALVENDLATARAHAAVVSEREVAHAANVLRDRERLRERARRLGVRERAAYVLLAFAVLLLGGFLCGICLTWG